ncbi:hypothetical protein NQ318_023256 [Aromia moschata]|uniref:Uncharacterized protein n=1 Tax=Aromia moschata TaxID=1265417 RepID=A0AAV8Y531_9CUCU|nr:hypothetical protein NQ318_023256 [Aromia moschata]
MRKINSVRQQKNPFELSPLLDMEEVEEELINKRRCLKGYSFKTPSKPSIKFTQEMKISPAAKETKLGKISTDKGVEKTLNSTLTMIKNS